MLTRILVTGWISLHLDRMTDAEQQQLLPHALRSVNTPDGAPEPAPLSVGNIGALGEEVDPLRIIRRALVCRSALATSPEPGTEYQPAPLRELVVADYDETCTLGSAAVGFVETPRGRHWYLLAQEVSADCVFGDATYAQLCKQRGAYTERLFNADGTPRPLPQIVWPHSAMVEHKAAFAELQAQAIFLGRNRPKQP